MYFAYLQADFTEGSSLAVNGLLDIVGNLGVSGGNGVGHGRVQEGVQGCEGRLWEKCGRGGKLRKKEEKRAILHSTFYVVVGGVFGDTRLNSLDLCILFVLFKFSQEMGCLPFYYFLFFPLLNPAMEQSDGQKRKDSLVQVRVQESLIARLSFEFRSRRIDHPEKKCR